MIKDKYYPITYRKDLSNYEINRLGKIRNKKTGKELKGSNNSGYLLYTLTNDDSKVVSIQAHILVANEFLPNPENKPIVNHIDENGMNPDIDNLEWSTHRENSNHGTCQNRKSIRRSYPINQYTLDGKYVRTWKCIKYAAYVYGKSHDQILNVISGKSKSASGYIWRKYNGDTNDIVVEKKSDHSRKIHNGHKYLSRMVEKHEILDEYLYKPESKEDIIEILENSNHMTKYEKELLKKLKLMVC